MIRIYQKPFGTFNLEIIKKGEKVLLVGSINDGKKFACSHLSSANKAVVFYTTEYVTINGKQVKCKGISLDDYTDVENEYLRLENEIKQEKAEKRNKEIQEYENGKLIRVKYDDGEYLQGYSVTGIARELLESIGAAEPVSGWGSLVNSELVKTLGTEFTFGQARAFMEPKLNKIKEAEDKIKEEIEGIFEKARTIGEKQVLRKYSAPCNDPRKECNVDKVIEYALPNGLTETVRMHTW